MSLKTTLLAVYLLLLVGSLHFFQLLNENDNVLNMLVKFYFN